jgi:hypothetical protein
MASTVALTVGVRCSSVYRRYSIELYSTMYSTNK